MVLSKRELGERIKRARELKSQRIGKKYTQAMLAVDVGMSRSYLGDIETGKKYPNYKLLSKIAQTCEVPLGFFDVEGFGNTIKLRREALNLSIDNVAQKTGLPIEKLQQIESNKPVNMSLDEWNALGNILEMSEHETYRIVQEDYLHRISLPDFNEDLDKTSWYVQALFNLDRQTENINVVMEPSGINKYTSPSNCIPIDEDNIIKLPIIGSIAAGQPIEAIPEEGEYFPFDTKLARADGKLIDDYFYLRIKGRSMEPNLMDGDIALIRKQPIVDNGQIAAILCDDVEATCKRITIAGDNIILNSDNPTEPTRIFKREQCRIIGKVIGHYRKDN